MYEPGDQVRYAGVTWTVVDNDGEDRLRISRKVNGGTHVTALPASHVRRPLFYGPNGAVLAGILVAAVMTAFLLLSVYVVHYLLDGRPYDVHVRGASAKAALFLYFDGYR